MPAEPREHQRVPEGFYTTRPRRPKLVTAQRAAQPRDVPQRIGPDAVASLLDQVQVIPPDMLRLFDPSINDRGQPYHEQHDPAMYTVQSLAARENLRCHPRVIDAIAGFSRLYRLESGGRFGHCGVRLRSSGCWALEATSPAAPD